MMIKNTSLFVFLFSCIVTNAQPKSYSPANAHAHNDYLNDTPFHKAYRAGFGSIEADVFPIEGRLYVAHSKKEIQPQHTLKNLYIDPLLHEFTSNRGRKLSLLIDIKENHRIALPLLIKELEPLHPFLSTLGKPNDLTIIISGDRPVPEAYTDYPPFIFFDDDLKLPQTAATRNRVALVSLPFNKISTWKGEGDLMRSEKKKLRRTIDSTHASGKPIRFWAAPDTETSWKQQMKLHVDLIGTDKIELLRAFLKKK